MLTLILTIIEHLGDASLEIVKISYVLHFAMAVALVFIALFFSENYNYYKNRSGSKSKHLFWAKVWLAYFLLMLLLGFVGLVLAFAGTLIYLGYLIFWREDQLLSSEKSP